MAGWTRDLVPATSPLSRVLDRRASDTALLVLFTRTYLAMSALYLWTM